MPKSNNNHSLSSVLYWHSCVSSSKNLFVTQNGCVTVVFNNNNNNNNLQGMSPVALSIPIEIISGLSINCKLKN
jgi:hypothetical protein